MTGRDVGYAVLSGLFLGSLFPPFRFEALAWIALVPLLWSLDRKRPHEGFALGFLTGLIAYAIIIWWVKITMVSYGGLNPVLAWLITLVLAAYMGVYVGLFAYGLVMIGRGNGLLVCLLAAPMWVSLELIRAYFLSGFPWALLGYSQYRVLPVVQIADLVGIYGVSFFIVAVNAAVWHFFRHPHRSPFWVVSGTAILSVLVLGYGYLRLAELSTTPAPSAQRLVGIVQGNTDQGEKWPPGRQLKILQTHEAISHTIAKGFPRSGLSAPPLIVWPEAAAPFIYSEQPRLKARIVETARQTGAYLLFGTLGTK
ncbi:MAG: apolipoprotein N-acyltransferase, partial [bacterium]|nr:apolipoprotein N-acyltransferase [bacterium]